MTLIIKTPTVSTANDLPKFFPDSRMNKGSLLLLDFSHPDCQLSGVPASGSTINNIAWQNAKKLIPSGIQSTLSPVASSSIIPTSGGLIEVTSKKGLHGIISQVGDSGSGNDFNISIPALIFNYVKANVSRGFFVSLWDRRTRLATTSTTGDFALGLVNTSNYYFGFDRNGNMGTNLGSFFSVLGLSNQRRTLGFNVATGTPSASVNSYESGYKFGSGFAYGGFENNKASSNILYQIHIVDLTSAGLTYAQADALDLAAWTAAFGVGGRFANDTFTNPATLP